MDFSQCLSGTTTHGFNHQAALVFLLLYPRVLNAREVWRLAQTIQIPTSEHSKRTFLLHLHSPGNNYKAPENQIQKPQV